MKSMETQTVAIDKKPEDINEKDSKPKRKTVGSTLPPKTGATYKEAYKEKLKRDKEEAGQETTPKQTQPPKEHVRMTQTNSILVLKSCQKAQLVQ